MKKAFVVTIDSAHGPDAVRLSIHNALVEYGYADEQILVERASDFDPVDESTPRYRPAPTLRDEHP